MRLLLRLATAGITISTVANSAQAVDWVWWEAEAPALSNLTTHGAFAPGNADEAKVLSGGNWLSLAGPRRGAEAFAAYDVSLPADGTYHFWSRKFWKHGPFRWRFDDGAWHTCGRDIALTESVTLRKNVEASWVSLGDVDLKKGKHTFEFRLIASPGEDQACGFDCFLLTRAPFTPNGKLKPGEATGLTEPGRFSFEPPADNFAGDAVLDLRALNEKVAGEHGPVRRENEKLVLGDGTPVRFWAVNVGMENTAQDHASVDYLARRLAKLGVNMIRFHSALWDGSNPRKIDAKKLDNLHYLIAAMKREGIYTTLSFYFPLWLDMTPDIGTGGFEALKNKKPFGLLFFDASFQALHRGWLDGILSTNNPYTDASLAKEPALAVIELVNEDSLFFHTFTKQNIPAAAWEDLERQYANWRRRKNLDPGENEILEAWHMTRDGIKAGGEGKRTRMSEQVRFLAETQRGFFEKAVKHLRDDLGYAGLVDCGNWKTADPALLEAVERWTYEAGDVIDRHGYFGPKLSGDASGYAVRVGQTVEDRCALLMPERLPIQMTQQEGYPSIITELMWTQPSKYRADCTAITAAYASLQGIDGVYFFAQQSNAVRDSTISKFQVGSPALVGTFPATALMYRRGDVTESAPLRTITASLESLFSLRLPQGADAQAIDEVRDDGNATLASTPATFIGKVVRARGDLPVTSTVRPGEPMTAVLKSFTHELSLDKNRGLLTITTPRCVAAIGNLRAVGPQALGGVTIDCKNDYASVFVISLDGESLADSKKILVQTMTDDQPFGWRVERGKIASVGAFPFTIAEIAVTVTLPRSGWKGTTLDANGVETAGNGTFMIAKDALYTAYTRE